jgi:signal transduction histidine kinase
MDSFGAVVADDLARIERLVEDILDYARYMKPKLSLESLNEIVSSSLQFMEIKASSLNVSIEKQLTEQLPYSMVDRQQIKQVLMNLILNAIDAMKTKGGWLTVSTRPLTRLDGTRWIQIHVSDTGCGIAPEDLPHIFDPFFTTKHESAEHAGTGLGLSIVHQIIQEHSGTIEAHSTVGQGTTFIVTLPEQSEQATAKTDPTPVWPGKLLPFPSLPPLLRRPTGTDGS